MTRYLLDANVFIQAKNLHYGFDFCPAFWEWLERKNGEESVASVEMVGSELAAGEDELTNWAKRQGEKFFLPRDAKVLSAYGKVTKWVTSNGYEPAAISTFLSVADSWLLAHALTYERVVVTHERAADTIKKVKIPNACIGLGIRFM
ncbi:MAG TPA: DUF4411 family protein, partial [Thermopetrobacter sp.]|nr:DUF4411 family protein [Thermopetrobacter sp.]